MSAKNSIISYSKFYLPNGIKCILYNRPNIHSIHISVTVNTGSLDETKENNGISHLLEHLPFDGTEKFKTWEELDKVNNSIAGSGNAYTCQDHTKYYGTYPFQYAKEAIEYYSQLIFFPLFKEDDVNKEKIIVLDEMKRGEDMVESKIYENILNSRFENNATPFSFKVIGTAENVSSFKSSDIKEHHSKYYVPENIEIVVAGRFTESTIKRYLEEYFYLQVKNRSFNKKVDRKFLENFPEYSDFRIDSLQKKDVDQCYLTFTFPSFNRTESSIEKRNSIRFLNNLIANPQYQQSILWKRLREELGLVYGVYSYDNDIISRSYICIETSFDPIHLETVLSEIYTGLNLVSKGKVTDEVFHSRKKRILDTQLMLMDNINTAINWIEEQESELELNKREITIEDYLDITQKTEFNDVIKSAEEILNWNNVNIGVVSKEEHKSMSEKVKQLWSKITMAK